MDCTFVWAAKKRNIFKQNMNFISGTDNNEGRTGGIL
jgi:hypothetical protein